MKEGLRPRQERARRNRATASLLMQRRHNPQHRLKLIEHRQSLISNNPLPSQQTLWNEKDEKLLLSN